jgi:hypothetical protein
VSAAIRYVCKDGTVIFRGGAELVEGSPVAEERRTSAKLAQVRKILSIAVPAVDRCLAAALMIRSTLEEIVTPKYATNMRGALRLVPSVVERLRRTNAPLALVFRIAAVDPLDQAEALEQELLKRADAVGGRRSRSRSKRKRSPTVRDRDRLEDLVNNLGRKTVRSILRDLGEPESQK